VRQLQTRIIGNIVITHDDTGKVYGVSVENQELKSIVLSTLAKTELEKKPFRPYRSKIDFPPALSELSKKIFEAIDQVRSGSNGECLAAYLASYYYECFTPTWIGLLDKMEHTLAACIWLRLLRGVWDWESAHTDSKIHKGTPYYFLAETFLLSGDTDLGFTYLYDAINESRRLGALCPRLRYPDKAPSNLTASLIDDPNNHMHSFVKELLDLLSTYIDDYNKTFNRNFSINTFTTEFLNNPKLDYPKYFFVYNLWFLSKIKESARRDSSLDNDFLMLRNLDTTFNLCLIVDKILERKYGGEYISQNVLEICRDEKWIRQDELQDFRKSIGEPDGDPDLVIPKLIVPNVTFQGKSIRREVICLLVAWNLRNYGGHNISRQKVLRTRFEEIIRALINCLFITIEARRAWQP
jgi:hypothetical protein